MSPDVPTENATTTEPDWTYHRNWSSRYHGYSAACGYCRTVWELCFGSEESAVQFLGTHQEVCYLVFVNAREGSR